MIDNKRIFQVDAFTDEPFKGNPAGVMIIDENITSDWMQNVAMEMNLSETAFIIPNKEGFKIRYFTPTREVPLCGHATLASSHIIYELRLKSKHETIEFKAEGADLTIKKENDWIIMSFPKYPINKINILKDLKKTLGFEPVEMYSSLYDWIIAVAENESDILNSKPDFELMKKNGLGHLMITAKSDSRRADFVVRCFAPTSVFVPSRLQTSLLSTRSILKYNAFNNSFHNRCCFFSIAPKSVCKRLQTLTNV